MMVFGLARFNIWTSSPEQIKIEKGKSKNQPDGTIYLKHIDAEWLKGFIANNGMAV